jgi:hypothetical protein
MKKPLKEFGYNSVDPRSSTAGDSSSAGRMKGSLRLTSVNPAVHKGNNIRPTAKLGILAAEELGPLPGTTTDMDVDADETLHGSTLRDFIRGEISKLSKRHNKK